MKNFLVNPTENDVELSKRMVDAAVKFVEESGGKWNGMMMVNAATLLLRFAVETSLSKEHWEKTMAMICHDVMSEIATKAEADENIPPPEQVH
jgi:hypothetical protein